MTSIIHPSKWQISHPKHRRRKCVWCTKMPLRRSVRHGMWRGHGPWHCWRWGRRDVPVGYRCLKFCEAWYTHVYGIYIYICIYVVYICIHIYVHWMRIGCENIFQWCCMACFSVSGKCLGQMTMNICEASYVDGCNETHILWKSMEGSTKALTTFTFLHFWIFRSQFMAITREI